MVDKSPDAFRTISEVAEDLDLPHHVLRFWETRFSQIKPLKRGGGRRYYRPDDVALIMGLKALLYGQGYTIKGVQRILKEQGIKAVQAIGRGAPVGADMQAARAEGDDASLPPPHVADPPRRAEPAIALPMATSGPAAPGPHPRAVTARVAVSAMPVGTLSVLKLALAELDDARATLARALER